MQIKPTEVSVTITADIETLWRCEGCEEVMGADDLEPLYECSSCGRTFVRSQSHTGENHQCPDCQKFGSKLSDHGCPECGEDECNEVDVAKCPFCDKDIAVDEWAEHISTNAC